MDRSNALLGGNSSTSIFSLVWSRNLNRESNNARQSFDRFVDVESEFVEMPLIAAVTRNVLREQVKIAMSNAISNSGKLPREYYVGLGPIADTFIVWRNVCKSFPFEKIDHNCMVLLCRNAAGQQCYRCFLEIGVHFNVSHRVLADGNQFDCSIKYATDECLNEGAVTVTAWKCPIYSFKDGGGD